MEWARVFTAAGLSRIGCPPLEIAWTTSCTKAGISSRVSEELSVPLACCSGLTLSLAAEGVRRVLLVMGDCTTTNVLASSWLFGHYSLTEGRLGNSF